MRVIHNEIKALSTIRFTCDTNTEYCIHVTHSSHDSDHRNW